MTSPFLTDAFGIASFTATTTRKNATFNQDGQSGIFCAYFSLTLPAFFNFFFKCLVSEIKSDQQGLTNLISPAVSHSIGLKPIIFHMQNQVGPC